MSMQAPGKVADLSASELVQWSGELGRKFQEQVEYTRQAVPQPPQPRAWFFDPVASGLDKTATKDIGWTAFPKRFPGQYVRVDGDRSLQEEYCEWEVVKTDGRLVRATFTTETLDYYVFLWTHARNRLLELYRQYVSPEVKLADLSDGADAYNPTNRWNWPTARRGTLMHMAQVNNSLEAAMNLSAVASWPVVTDAGVPVTSEQALIRCLAFGVAARHSDPHIGAQINELVRAGNEVSFADPVGLYIDSVDLSEFETPDGSPVQDLMRRTRGEDRFSMRIVFEAPPGSAFVLGEVSLAGDLIQTAGQIAEKLRIRIRGAAREASTKAPKLNCTTKIVEGAGPQPAMAAAAPAPVSANSRLPSGAGRLSPE